MGAPRFATALFLLALCFSAFSVASAAEKTPSVLLQNEDGQDVFLKTLLAGSSDRVLVLSFGASWCAPCLKEIPALVRAVSTYSGIRLAFIAEDAEGPSRLQAFLRRRGISAPVYGDPSGNARRTLSLSGLPSTLFLAPDGTELWRADGFSDWTSPEKTQKLVDLAKGQRNR